MKEIIIILEHINPTEIQSNYFEKFIEKAKELIDYFEMAKLIWIIIFILIIGIILLFNKHNVNKKSKAEYEKNEKNGKYKNELYVELGTCNEMLRYMYFNKKWKKRIKNELKEILETNVGKMIRKKCNIKFYSCITLKGLHNTLIKCNEYLEKSRKMTTDKTTQRNFNFYLEINGYYIRDRISKLLDESEMISNNICFILGRAGSGKTNLLTYFAKVLICNYKAQCIYIDSKDIADNDIEKKVFSFFYVNHIIDENKNFIIQLLLLLKRIFNQEIVIIIEAINEKSNKEFYKNLSRFISKYHKYKNMKIIVSSRTEFYNLRFKEIFDEYIKKEVQYKILTIENSIINDAVYEKMYLKYKKYFNFNGTITNSVKEVLFESPLFMKIFFECYKDSNQNISDINKSKIFSEYISRLSKKYPKANKILDKMINIMLEDRKFDNVSKKKLDISDQDIQNLANENILLTHSIIENDGKINETKSEIISITYDEIRDYLLTINIIDKYDKNNINIESFIDEMIQQRYPILDGVIKRIYLYFKQIDTKICSYILNKKLFLHYNYGNNDTYNNAHLDFIFSSRQDLNEIEKTYLTNLEYITPNDLAKIIWDSTYNLIHGLHPSIDFIQNEMMNFIKGEKKVYDFSKIESDLYKNLIKELKKYKDNATMQYIETLTKLLKYLERGYYEKN